MGNDARSTVLGRIRAALAGTEQAPVRVPRDYGRQVLSGRADSDRFAEAVAEYRAGVYRITQAEIAQTVAALVGDGTVVIPGDIPWEWVCTARTLVDEPPLDVDQLEQAAAVVTGCAVGIAATGTIVLDGGAAQGRRILTLLPDHHICVIRTDQIVDTVPQGISALDPIRPLTFISGPSATSDIELERVEGVHGPRILDVLVVAMTA